MMLTRCGALYYYPIYLFLVCTLLPSCNVGCTSQSTKLAIQSSKRVESAQDEIFTKQHQALSIAYYAQLRAFCSKLAGRELNDAELEYLNSTWVQRDGMEGFVKNWERARALKMITVDRKLIDDQSIFDLIYKNLKDFFDAPNDPVTPNP